MMCTPNHHIWIHASNNINKHSEPNPAAHCQCGKYTYTQRDLENFNFPNFVQRVSELFGYGALMHEASRQWGETLVEKYGEGADIGAFVVGPCKGLTVPCKCGGAGPCDWCEGTGWVTPHVRALQDAA